MPWFLPVASAVGPLVGPATQAMTPKPAQAQPNPQTAGQFPNPLMLPTEAQMNAPGVIGNNPPLSASYVAPAHTVAEYESGVNTSGGDIPISEGSNYLPWIQGASTLGGLAGVMAKLSEKKPVQNVQTPQASAQFPHQDLITMLQQLAGMGR